MFESLEHYPELQQLQSSWQIIRDEAIKSIDLMVDLGDWRSERGQWRILPLMVEEEDAPYISNELIQSSRKIAPRTVALVEKIPQIKSVAFSLVEPNGFIKAHCHENPYASASLCLQSGGRNMLVVEQERRYLKESNIAVFDYRKPHAVYNWGNKSRIALIVALPGKWAYSEK